MRRIKRLLSKKLDRVKVVLAEVEGPAANAEGNESFQEETQNDCK
jgi:hypothetical protein